MVAATLAAVLAVPALAIAAEPGPQDPAQGGPVPVAPTAGPAKDAAAQSAAVRTLAVADDGSVPAATTDEKLEAAAVVALDVSQPSDPLSLGDRDFVFEIWMKARAGSEVKSAALLALGDWDPAEQVCVACTLYIRRGILDAEERDMNKEIRDRQHAEAAERRRTQAAELVELPITPRLAGSNDRDFVIALWTFLTANKAGFTATIAAAQQAFTTTTPAAVESFLATGLATAYAADQRRLIDEAAGQDEAQKLEANRRFDRKKAANAVGIDVKVDDETWMASTDDVFLRDVARRLKGVPFWSLTYAALADEVLNGSAESWQTMISTGIYQQVEQDRLRRNKEIMDGYRAEVTEVRDAAIRDGLKNIARAGTTALASNSISTLWSYLEKRESLPADSTEMTLLQAAGTNITAIITRGQIGRWWSVDRQAYKSGAGWDVKKSRPFNGDFDGDGKRDVAVLYGSGASWRVQFLSNIDGKAPKPKLVWDSPADATTKKGYSLKSAAAGDLNGDGRTDLAVYGKNAADKPVLVTLIPGANGKWVAKEVAAPAALIAGRLAAGDVTGDKKADLITIIQDATKGMQIWVAPATATGTGKAVAKWADKKFDLKTTTEPVAADFNKDGLAEIALFRQEKETHSNNGASLHLFAKLNGTVARSEAWRIEGGLGAAKIIATAADVNGDDYVDLLVHYAIVADQTRTYAVLNGPGGFTLIKEAGGDTKKIADLRIAR